jgi:hypothetical protein
MRGSTVVGYQNLPSAKERYIGLRLVGKDEFPFASTPGY